jgi:TolB-like protein/class 3 adenylate cyclase/Tfp pilus assembly protein PilF
MAADVVGYSRLIDANETATLAAIKTLRAHVTDPLIAEFRGRIVKLMGDGMLLEFGSLVDAVQCAVAIQTQLPAAQRDVGPERRIVFRIGINLGDVVVDGDDLLGDGVNVAARLEQLCPKGGILISGTAYDQLRGKLDLPLDFVGEQRVKNISQPVRTYSVRLEGAKRDWRLRTRPLRRHLLMMLMLITLAAATGVAVWWLRPAEPALTGRPSIAVLPFDNIGSDEMTVRFAEGITEDIITDLSRYRAADVIARNSTAVYKGKPMDIRQVGKELNVRYALQGSVQRQGDQIRITAQLIDARTAAHLWSDRWDRPVADLFAVQTEISEQVALRLVDAKNVILASEAVAVRRASPADLTAYELYLRGREALHRFTKESAAEAISLLRVAVEKDSTLARAWVELAGAYNVSIDFGGDTATLRAESLSAAQRAVALDPMDADAHAQLAHILGTRAELDRAKAEFDAALRLNPGSADVLMMYVSWAATWEGPQRAAEIADRIIRLNPSYPTWAIGPFSFVYVMAGRYADALRVLERESTDNYTIYSWIHRAVSYAMLDRPDEAKLWVARTLEKYPDLTIQGYLSPPEWIEADRKHLIPIMRKAGFPPCATPVQLKTLEKPIPLPECSASVAR